MTARRVKSRLAWALVALALAGAFWDSTVYVVKPHERALVTRFGRIVGGPIGPGLHVKLPLIEGAHIVDTRLKLLRVEPQGVLTKTGKPLLVDAFVAWRVRHVRAYLLTTGGHERVAAARLREIVASVLRASLGAHSLHHIVGAADARARARVARAVAGYGLAVADLRVQRIAFTGRLRDAVAKRMAADALRRAARLKSRGMARAARLRAEARRRQAAIAARAYRAAQGVRAQAATKAARLYAVADRSYPHFFPFYMGLKAYARSFANRRTTLILGPGSGFLRLFGKPPAP